MGTTGLPFRRLLDSVLSIAFCSIALHCHVALAAQDEYAGVVTTHFMRLNPRAGSRFLAAAAKGDRCDPIENNVCLGIKAKNGRQLLQCCKNHCRNVLSDRNHCGYCGHKCGFGQLCCRGKCTAVAYDVRNCGKCGTVCSPELRCEYGSCGYA